MTLPIITGLYAGILGILFAILGARVGIMRGKLGISLFHADNQPLGVAIRQHGNLAEWLPVLLILIGLLEMSNAPIWAIHGLGGGLLVARLIHPFGLNFENGNTAQRAFGAGLSTLVIVVAGGWLIYNYFVRVTV